MLSSCSILMVDSRNVYSRPPLWPPCEGADYRPERGAMLLAHNIDDIVARLEIVELARCQHLRALFAVSRMGGIGIRQVERDDDIRKHPVLARILRGCGKMH